MSLATSPRTLTPALAKVGPRLTARERMVRSVLRNTPALMALALLVAAVLMAIFAQQLAPHDPVEQTLARRLLPPFWEARGTLEYPLGTDKLGRDVLSRIIFGSRVSLLLGFTASLGSVLIGVSLGLISGYRSGVLGDSIMRVAEAQLAFPFMVAAIAVIAVVGPSFTSLVLILSVWGWATFAKVVRADVLSVKEKEYVEAARVIGAGGARIVWRHLLPNILSPVIVLWSFSVAGVILAESGLSFIGMGIQPPTPAWGSMLADGREILESAWWLATFPGLAIVTVVLVVNIIGDALRDILDPRLR